jgi:2-polyprenyl-3-methyl-5-hydroxy-6-metoxy-1,4-benzoquinol methylase
MISRCRSCGKELLPDLLFRMENMPSAAQHFPERGELAADRGVPLTLRQCSGCGLVQLDSEPVAYYREVIRASAYSPAMKEFRLSQFSDWIARYGLARKRILEPGCGRGEYLELMASCGADVSGTEYGPESVRFCRDRGLEVEPVYFEHGTERLPAAPFDAFFMLNWLEHIPSPSAFLQAVRGNLRAGAAGLVEVPNFDMILKHGLLTEICAEHLYYFSEKTLRNTLENNGFDVISCRPVWEDYILSAEVVKRNAVSLSGFSDRREKIFADVRNFLAGAKHAAVWGAGHQSMAVMAMLGMSADSICYVVDSSPLKQGKYTFTTHIPIVPPSRLDSDVPDALIVMCAGYSDEVARQVRARFGNTVKLAVMRNDGLEVC